MQETQNDTYRQCDTETLVRQIGKQNILAISGGRVTPRETGVTLPVRYGYKVEVDLAGNDTYTVKRVFDRDGDLPKIHGKRENVHAEEVGEQAYQASCYKDDWP